MKPGTGYNTTDGRYSDVDEITLFPSQALTTTTAGSPFEVGGRGTVRLTLDVTASSGTPTLDVTVQTRKDANDSWRAVAAFAQKTGVSVERKCFAGLDREVRVNCVIGGGSPNITFSVKGELV